ncbi:16S rRNA methyltransferase [Thermogymnomonas acidicola]|uniref:Ribosomal RNA small subunit methyltransferase Nep1 n=2 Tax=Thermogymnomonas acidicola TaxID=399579 RepID=A0AA37BR86_9ARCH|nr:16S rRNA methyltransferase [Thermogymnomonas acidicola]
MYIRNAELTLSDPMFFYSLPIHVGMLNVVIADAELELIPGEMLDDYQVRKYAKKRKKPAAEVLLDSNFLHGAIERHFPGGSTRMGRPDIFYILLQVLQESILNKRGLLRVYIHTKHNKVIHIAPQTRVPKSYNRFVGLMEDLFKKQEIQSGQEKLLTLKDADLFSLLDDLGKEVVLLSPRGRPSKPEDIIREDMSLVIGGFAEGDFQTDVYSRYSAHSIFPDELTIWSVASEIVVRYECMFGPL